MTGLQKVFILLDSFIEQQMQATNTSSVAVAANGSPDSKKPGRDTATLRPRFVRIS